MPRHTDRVSELIIDLWTQTRMDWGFATDRIAQVFRKERSLSSRERREISETLYGMIRYARRIDCALEGMGTIRAGGMRELARYLVYRVMSGEMTQREAALAMPVLGGEWMEAFDARLARERDPIRKLAMECSLPDWLARCLVAEFGKDAQRVAEAMNERAPLTLRANIHKTNPSELALRLDLEGISSRPTRFAPNGLVLDTRVNAFGLKAFKEGLFELQDEGSQLVAELVAPPPHSLVIDYCAGAGGKTLALGAALAGKGHVVALDVDERKLLEARKRTRRAGLSNVRALAIKTDYWPDEVLAMEGKAARVLVDAPCSGIGALRRNPEARWRLAEDDPARLASKQDGIIGRAARLVAPGGRLIYATCTILPVENEDVVDKFLAREPEFRPMRIAEIWGKERAHPISDANGYLKMLPHRHDTDGFFAAVLVRRS